MRKILALALCLLTMLVPLAARAEAAPETALAWLPAGATYLGEEPAGSGRALSYQTDENAWTLTLDGAGNALSLQSAGAAAGGLQTRAEAEAALWTLDEAALILRAEEGDGPARLYFVATGAAGWAQFATAGGLAAGAVAFGQFLSNGQLTFALARSLTAWRWTKTTACSFTKGTPIWTGRNTNLNWTPAPAGCWNGSGIRKGHESAIRFAAGGAFWINGWFASYKYISNDCFAAFTRSAMILLSLALQRSRTAIISSIEQSTLPAA